MVLWYMLSSYFLEMNVGVYILSSGCEKLEQSYGDCMMRCMVSSQWNH